jgi:predicted O-methyltransferase YrrM
MGRDPCTLLSSSVNFRAVVQSVCFREKMSYLEKPAIRPILFLVDLVLSLASIVSAPTLWLVRRVGLMRLPLCRRILTAVGVLPLRRHYYDPYVDRSLLKIPLDKPRDLPGLEMNHVAQLELLCLMRLSSEVSQLGGAKSADRQFHFNNGSFESGDAEFLYQFVRLKKPKRVIEIGSGFSTLLVRDALVVNRLEDPDAQVVHTCIEPFEMQWLEKAGIRTIRSMVEDVPLSLFEELEQGDLLFIDSSHVIRPQGDVLTEYLRILPRLQKGVFVHVHDIFTPRDYPAEWVLERMWLWNEQYLVETMLSYSKEWHVVAALNYLKHSHFSALQAACPFLTQEREPGSLYMVKT